MLAGSTMNTFAEPLEIIFRMNKREGQVPGWQLCRGIGGRLAVEWVAGLLWNQWLVWRGIRTRAFL